MLDAVKMNLDNSRTGMNDVDDSGYSALHYAARYNRLPVVEVLVKAGAGLCFMDYHTELIGLHRLRFEKQFRPVKRRPRTQQVRVFLKRI